MIAQFNENRAELETLVKMFASDPELRVVSSADIMTTTRASWPRPQSEWGLTPDRWEEYKKALRAAKLRFGIIRNEDYPTCTIMPTGSFGLFMGGASTAYVFCEEAPTPTLREDDHATVTLGHDVHSFRRIAPKWYIMRAVHR